MSDLTVELLLVGEFPLQSDPDQGGLADPGFPGSPVQLAVQGRADLDLDPAGSFQVAGSHLMPRC